MPSLVLASPVRRALDRVAADLRRIFAQRFVALVASGPASSVAFAETLATGDLDAIGTLVHTWHKDGLDTPLLLTPDEFRRSLDAFPLEYQAIIDHHLVIAGTPPFQAVVVGRAELRRACEVQAKSHLIHLRQGWIEAAGHEDTLAALVARSAAPLRALLANVARLRGDGSTTDDAAMMGARAAGLPDTLIRDILALEHDSEQADQLVPRLADYVSAAERLWAFVDEWQ